MSICLCATSVSFWKQKAESSIPPRPGKYGAHKKKCRKSMLEWIFHMPGWLNYNICDLRVSFQVFMKWAKLSKFKNKHHLKTFTDPWRINNNRGLETNTGHQGCVFAAITVTVIGQWFTNGQFSPKLRPVISGKGLCTHDQTSPAVLWFSF